MARDQSVTDADLDDASEAIREQRADIREYLEAEGVDVSEWGDDLTDPVVRDRERADSD